MPKQPKAPKRKPRKPPKDSSQIALFIVEWVMRAASCESGRNFGEDRDAYLLPRRCLEDARGIAGHVGGAFPALGSVGHLASISCLGIIQERAMRYASVISAFLVATLAMPSSALAWGALVVGVPPDVSKQGFAFGIDANSPTEDAARDAAMGRCKTTNAPNSTYVGSPSPVAQGLCTLVTTFRGQCAVVADDPASGTPGVGWAVAPTLEDATAQAVNNCMATAGESRKQYCARQLYSCDTN